MKDINEIFEVNKSPQQQMSKPLEQPSYKIDASFSINSEINSLSPNAEVVNLNTLSPVHNNAPTTI